jgi:hypothetical protein
LKGNAARIILITIVGTYGILMIPDKEPTTILSGNGTPFVWNQEEFWNELEQKFIQAQSLSVESNSLLDSCDRILINLRKDSLLTYKDPRLDLFLKHYFELGPLAIASNKHQAYSELYNRARKFIKDQSLAWEMDNPGVRNRLYTLFYGMRASSEEVLLQSNTRFEPVQFVTDEPSATPAAQIQGITIHSGDLLVSRGGAEVSAFISRGNDYPGNFSHVALLYVDSSSNIPYLIEAHIEKGVAIATMNDYLRDTKLRFMVLRPRADLALLQQNQQLPHEAAKLAYEEAQQRHIPYDFKMNFYDSTSMFCSEVGSYAYRKKGLQLWSAISTISSSGTARWLNTFGVENFVTQMPSDLEYDPQLSVVAEWRDPETLLKDHIDNAVMDALLEEANNGRDISYNSWLLPIARIVKMYSLIQNYFGSPGTIPEGMSATRALKNNSFVTLYANTKQKTLQKIQDFKNSNGYVPPYWKIVRLARESVK